MTAVRSRLTDLRPHLPAALAMSVLLALSSGADGATRPGMITMQATGQITAGHRYDLQFQTSGRIRIVSVQAGAHVHAGDVLAALDQAQARAQLASARATLLAARSELASLDRRGARTAEDRAVLLRDRRAADAASAQLDAAVATARAQLASASAASAQASSALTRSIHALAENTTAVASSQSDVTVSASGLAAAKRALAAARVQVEAAQAMLAQDEKLDAASEGELAKHVSALQDAETDYQIAVANADGASAASARQLADTERRAISTNRDQLTHLAQTLIDDQAEVSARQAAAQQDADSVSDAAATLATAAASAERLRQGLADARARLPLARDAVANARHAEAVQRALGRAAGSAAAGARSEARAVAEVTRRTQNADASSARRKAYSDLAAAEAQVDLAVAVFGSTILRAPADGIVAAVSVAPGDTVGASGSPATALTIVTDVAHVTAAFDEVDAAKIRVGQSASVSIRAFDDMSLPATVIRIGLLPSTNSASVDGTPNSAAAAPDSPVPGTTSDVGSGPATYDLELRLHAGDQLLRPGMTATVKLETPAHSG